MLVNLVFDYYTDVISVPDDIVPMLKKYQNRCDKWLYNKLNNHSFWEKDKNGNKIGVGICSEAFVFWLNDFALKGTNYKAEIVQENAQQYDETLPTLYY